MTSSQSPVIIRQVPVQRWVSKPDLYFPNIRPLLDFIGKVVRELKVLQICFKILAFAGVGYCVYMMADEFVYQPFQNWVFEQGIAGRTNVTFFNYFREDTFLGLFINGNPDHTTPNHTRNQASTAPAHGVVLGRLEIPQLNLSAVVREGVDDQTLRESVGHVSATALAGQSGNFAITAHHNVRFHALKNIESGDLIVFQASDGSSYQYRVAATQIVKPSDVSMLRADGGGLIIGGGSVHDMPKLLTVITCYPFFYAGSAPKRFIVEARLVEDEGVSREAFRSAVPANRLPVSAIQDKSAKSIHRIRAYTSIHRRTSRFRHHIFRKM